MMTLPVYCQPRSLTDPIILMLGDREEISEFTQLLVLLSDQHAGARK